jgi:hypothetical protein
MDNKAIAQKAGARVEEVREIVRAAREQWNDMAGMNGINVRWLRAFANGQIKQPPAERFLALERWLTEQRLLTRRV